jgi:hypothetical protein
VFAGQHPHSTLGRANEQNIYDERGQNSIRSECIVLANCMRRIKCFPLQVDFLATLRMPWGSSSSSSPQMGREVLTLAELCARVDNNPPLRLAKIVSTECYTQKAGSVFHRFLVMELRMPNRDTLWLRLDRRMAKDAGYWDLVMGLGQTEADDAVSICCRIL